MAGSSLYFPKASNDTVNNGFSEIDYLNSDLFNFYGPE